MSRGVARVGVIGVGAMGGGMARRLLSRGFDVLAWNRSPARLDAVVARGASPAAGIAQVMAESDILLVSLRSSEVLVEVADRDLVPAARRGQVVVDTGTTEVAETRRLAAAFARKGAAWIDAPVSGGEAGAEGGQLRVFIGGDPGAADRLAEVFAALSAPGKAVYCGPSGAGQMMKYVNQMAMGLVEAAYIETAAAGQAAGACLLRARRRRHEVHGPAPAVARIVPCGRPQELDRQHEPPAAVVLARAHHAQRLGSRP
jgi:3-hydroxyisobutyrate dehydrogenase-like beta-hydroxyacid dehydrogenase